jgi:hypothetical protein
LGGGAGECDGAECETGHCVDGLCCNEACDDVCRACNIPGNEGTCRDLPALQDDAPDCAGAMTCDGAGRCKSDVGQPCNGHGQCATGECVGDECQ